MAKGEQTRERMIGEALRLGTIHGFGSISLADIADAVALSKSAVFKHFGAKDTLQLAVLERLVAVFTEKVWAPARNLPRGKPRLDRILDGWLAWVDGDGNDGGCGLIQAQIEFDDQPGVLRSLLKRKQLQWNATLAGEFRSVLGGRGRRTEAELAAFEFRCIVLGYNQSRRLLDDPSARTYAMRAYGHLMARIEQVAMIR